jgi:uncharacterized damage-inducible protein DinB
MSDQRTILRKALGSALSGTGAHSATRTVFADLDWRLAGIRPDGAPHSAYQLLNHMRYWQAWVLGWLDGESPPLPAHAAGSWRGGVLPASRRAWESAVREFESGVDALERRASAGDPYKKHGGKRRLEMLSTIASHNSYHAGQVVMLRQLLGAWPPRTGGLTW